VAKNSWFFANRLWVDWKENNGKTEENAIDLLSCKVSFGLSMTGRVFNQGKTICVW